MAEEWQYFTLNEEISPHEEEKGFKHPDNFDRARALMDLGPNPRIDELTAASKMIVAMLQEQDAIAVVLPSDMPGYFVAGMERRLATEMIYPFHLADPSAEKTEEAFYPRFYWEEMETDERLGADGKQEE